MSLKTMADCVEALIGAYYIGGGIIAALHSMKWLGIDAELDPSLVVEAITAASLRSYVWKDNEVATLELKLGYEFSVKGLLQEAITHASQQELGVGYCYQVAMDILSRFESLDWNFLFLPPHPLFLFLKYPF